MTWTRELSIDSIVPDYALSDLDSYLTDSDCAAISGRPHGKRDTFAKSRRGRIRRIERRQSRRLKESLGYMAGV